ncbi:MAG: DUF6809 family protein [Alphaproteobacteria bacterium]
MNRLDMVSVGFDGLLKKAAVLEKEGPLMDALDRDPRYAEIVRKENDAAGEVFEFAKTVDEVRAACEKFHDAQRDLARLEMEHMFRAGFKLGLEIGLEAKKTEDASG